jgi:putative phage-type endonuclease
MSTADGFRRWNVPPLSEEQLTMRLSGLGSSDIGAVVGESPWGTAHGVWLEKLGLTSRDVDEDKVWLGNELEPILARRYASEVGVEIIPGPGTVRHPEHPWVLASTDYEHADGSAAVECKVVGWRVEHHWDATREDGIPGYVMSQVQWQLGVRGMKHFAVPVLFTSDCRFRIFRATFDQRVFDALLEIGRRFWFDRVLARVPPETDGSDDARRVLTTLYPRPMKQLQAAPAGSFDAAMAYNAAKEVEKRAKADASLAGNRLRQMIGEAEGIEASWGRVTWSSDKTGKRTLRVNVKDREAA